MGQAGFLDHDETARSIRNFARYVFPRLKAEMPDNTVSGFSLTAEEAAVRVCNGQRQPLTGRALSDARESTTEPADGSLPQGATGFAVPSA